MRASTLCTCVKLYFSLACSVPRSLALAQMLLSPAHGNICNAVTLVSEPQPTILTFVGYLLPILEIRNIMNTVMSRIIAGAYGRISRGSSHASIQVMLTFETCFYVNIFSLHCAVHIVTHLCVVCKYMIHACFYSNHASVSWNAS